MTRTTLEATSLAPAEAIAFLRQKANVTSQRWTDVWQEAHSRSFMVAGAASQALVQDFRDAVAKAIEQGTTLAEFRRDFDRIVAEHGWVHNGSPAWRSRIILETNLSTAYSAGRYAQMTEPDTLRVYPYWQYTHTSSAHPRPQHLAWVGTTLRADDPWWSTHYPPNGWRCKCGVRPLSQAGLGRMGKDGPDPAPDLNLKPWRNPHTGEVIQVPDGIDPGFAYNPGQAWQSGTPPPETGGPGTPPLPRAPQMPPAEAVPPPRTPPPFDRPDPEPDVLRFLRAPQGEIIVGRMPAPLAEALGTASRGVTLSAQTMAKQLARHPDLVEADYLRLRDLMAKPALVLRQDERRLVLLAQGAEGVLAAFVKAVPGADERFLVSLRRSGPKDVVRMAALHRLIAGSIAELLKGDGAPEGPPRNPS